MSKDLKSLSNLIKEQSYILSLTALYLSDHAVMIQNMIKKCENCLSESATVEHKMSKYKFCDHCAAKNIVLESNNHEQENTWIDIDNADKIRRLSEYVKIIKRLDVSNDEVQ